LLPYRIKTGSTGLFSQMSHDKYISTGWPSLEAMQYTCLDIQHTSLFQNIS